MSPPEWTESPANISEPQTAEKTVENATEATVKPESSLVVHDPFSQSRVATGPEADAIRQLALDLIRRQKEVENSPHHSI